jgi:hypothetical protein
MVQVELNYTGALSNDDPLAQAMMTCDANGPLMVNITKLFVSQVRPSCFPPQASHLACPSPPAFMVLLQDGTKFDAFGRVLSGTLTNHTDVKVRVGKGEGVCFGHATVLGCCASSPIVLRTGVRYFYNSTQHTTTLCPRASGAGGKLHPRRPGGFSH